MSLHWVSGNRFTLLENGEEFFPRVFEVIASAEREVLLETFILYEDKVGRALHAALLQAAARGVQIDVTVDGFGSPHLSDSFVGQLIHAGVRVHVFDPVPKMFRHLNLFRRLHRKLVVVDGRRGFIGGINFAADHLADYGPHAKQDYAVEAEGPIVARMQRFMRQAVLVGNPRRRWHLWRSPTPPLDSSPSAGDAAALFVWRDNRRHHSDIEHQYRLAMRLAQRRIVIANAYFFPGYLFLRELRRAVQRGVEVDLILQGNPDMPIVTIAASMLYPHLLRGGVRIYEFYERPLHGKVALVDEDWATVGSSNLDPLSLSLNLEANVVIRDRDFNRRLDASLQYLMQHSCKRVDVREVGCSGLWVQIRSALVFHFLRRFPAWLGWLPAHAPRLALLKPASPPLQEPLGADRIDERATS